MDGAFTKKAATIRDDNKTSGLAFAHCPPPVETTCSYCESQSNPNPIVLENSNILVGDDESQLFHIPLEHVAECQLDVAEWCVLQPFQLPGNGFDGVESGAEIVLIFVVHLLALRTVVTCPVRISVLARAVSHAVARLTTQRGRCGANLTSLRFPLGFADPHRSVVFSAHKLDVVLMYDGIRCVGFFVGGYHLDGGWFPTKVVCFVASRVARFGGANAHSRDLRQSIFC